MMNLLRDIANAEAQIALRAMNDHYARTGRRDGYLDARYEAAERLLDMIDAEITARQEQDPGAPDYFTVFVEGDLRADWGNR